MADDQIKYSDLIADDVVKGLEVLNQALLDIKATMAGVKEEAAKLGVSLKNVSTATREQQQETSQQASAAERLSKKMKDLSEEERRVEELKKRYKKLTDEQISRVDRLATALSRLKDGTKESTAYAIGRINAINAENMSYNELQATYNALKDSLNAMTVAERQNTEAGKAMTAQSAKIYDTMNELQKATGKYTLQVGKYRAAFDGLGYSFRQILREAPSAVNLNQFFLAISNNIPMFIDQLKAFKEEQAGIKANLANMTEGTEEYAEQLGKVESVGKKLAKVLVSWQTLVLAGLMIIRNWDRIVSGITNLFSNLTKEQKMFKAVNDEAANSVGEMTAKFVALQKEWRNLAAEDREKWVKQHKDDWSELGISINSVDDAENIYVNNTSIVQKAIDDRARSIAAMKLAAEKYEEAFKKQVEAEQGLQTRQSSIWSRMSRGMAGAGMAEGSGMLTAEQMESQARAEEEAIDKLHKKRLEEARALQDEAKKLIETFVLPEQLKDEKEKKTKDPKKLKDQVDDLLTLTRQLEDQVIANIEDEFEREEMAEIKRHERFVEDKQKELELVKGDPERIAVINKQIEEDKQTHDRNMLEIDEKYRQQVLKRIEDERKAEEKAKAEAFKQEEKEFKMRQEIEKRKFELTAHTATEEKKFVMEQQMELLQWRMNHAEALGISPEMLEVMEQEYEQMKKMYDLGKYSTGKQNVKGNYTSVMDMLFPDMDNDQKGALNSVFDQAKEALNGWMDARKAAAEQAKELADDEVSAAENALNREIELRNQGYANDVALRERELADAKKRQKEATDMQKKAEKDALAVNSAMEASSMAVAIANLFKDFPLYAAIPLTAVLLGSFATAKVQSFQAIKSTKYKEGGVMLLDGGSHESGHDVNLGIGPDGSNLRAEGGEYFAVINKRNSRKYGSEIPGIVNALNSGVFEDRYIKTRDAVGLAAMAGAASGYGNVVDLSAVESGVGELVKQGERSWSTEGEYRVMRYKNLTRRIKISG